jgi:hypothetical protein
VSARRKRNRSEVLAAETIFGPPPILPGEDRSAYAALLERLSGDVKPKDMVERIWVRDIVDHTWEILRLRRIKKGLVSPAVQIALSKHLEQYVYLHPKYPKPDESGEEDQDEIKALCDSLADDWIMKDPDVVAWIKQLEGYGSFSLDEVLARGFSEVLNSVERIDHLVTVAEARRNSVFREMQRRREFARSLRAEIQKVEDAEFRVIDSESTPRKITTSKKVA